LPQLVFWFIHFSLEFARGLLDSELPTVCCVCGPSISGLQYLLNTSYDYVLEHEIVISYNKTVGVVCSP